MNDILCSVSGVQDGQTSVKCEHRKGDLGESSVLIDNWEHEFQFIEEAEMQGNVYEISDFNDAQWKIEACGSMEINQDIKHEPEIQIEPENDKEVTFATDPVHSTQSTANLYKCSNCNKSFKRKATLKAHLKFEHSDELSTDSNENRPKNEDNRSSSESLTNGFWKCTECDMVFSVKFDFKMHKNQHEGKEVFQCDICKAYLSNNKILMHHKTKLHVNSTDKEKRFPCLICGERFSLQVFLSNHKKTHSEYINQLQETADIHRVNGRLAYTCKICGKLSSNKSRHEEHLRVHTKERPFQCRLCGSEFTAKSSLVLHMRLHSDERPFKCEICNQSYRHKKNLARHLFKHGGQLPFECRYCNKAFSLNSIRSDHERLRHTGETPYQCEKCEERFKTSFQLNAHRRGKHDIVTNSKRKVEILIKGTGSGKERNKGNS